MRIHQNPSMKSIEIKEIRCDRLSSAVLIALSTSPIGAIGLQSAIQLAHHMNFGALRDG